MEIVFVGECEVFVCLCFVVSFFFPLGREAHRSENWASILEKLTPTPLTARIGERGSYKQLLGHKRHTRTPRVKIE